MEIISVKKLCKNFRQPKKDKGWLSTIRSLLYPEYTTKVALDQVSFSIHEGDLIGYIGPNGAGKSTTLKILSGILIPDSGEVRVMGKIPWESRVEVVRELGVVFGQRTQLFWDLPVIDSFTLFKDMYRLSDQTYKKSLATLTEQLDLSHLYHLPVRQLSLGERMRCELAASLLHEPKILFLDEPTIGLDAVNKNAVRQFIRELNQEKKVTIILTTHDMDDIESLSNRVILLNEGHIFLDGTLNQLRQKMAPDRYLIVDLMNQEENTDDLQPLLHKKEGSRLSFRFNPSTISAPQLISRITAKYAVRDLFLQDPSMEEIVANFYKEKKR